jgi:hypothetical protein
MSTMPRPKTVLPLGIGWQLWTPAALALLASCGELNAHPASGMTGAQRALIAETLCCLRARLPSRVPRQANRAGETGVGWHAAPAGSGSIACGVAVDALTRGGVWLWWRQPDATPRLDLFFLRVGR